MRFQLIFCSTRIPGLTSFSQTCLLYLYGFYQGIAIRIILFITHTENYSVLPWITRASNVLLTMSQHQGPFVIFLFTVRLQLLSCSTRIPGLATFTKKHDCYPCMDLIKELLSLHNALY